MKGVLLSLFALLLNMFSAAVIAHVLRPKRYLYLFALSSVAWAFVYIILFLITPLDLGFLPHAWMITEPPLDLVYGLIVYFLNCHTFVDCFFATCGGFSVSLLVAILKSPLQSATTDGLQVKFKLQPQPDQRRMAPGLGPVDGTLAPQESDRIYAWRVSHLVKRGYLSRDAAAQRYSLTPKGRMVATLALTLKRLMNLGEGG